MRHISGKNSLATNIRLLDDVIEHSIKLENTSGGVIFLEFLKAFDSLEWNFIAEVLICIYFATVLVQKDIVLP